MARLERLLSVQSVRIACHLAVAAPFVVACGDEMAHGWIAQGDDGVIVFRSWAVLTTHSPLVGQLTHVASSHATFDPGPLLFWLLTIPVHLDPVRGGLWGASLLCILAASLAVEAAWSVRGWPAAVGVAAVVLLTIAELPALALDPVWNARMGLVWFMATVVIAWAVATGRLRWWPVLVVAGSISAQSHLMFAGASIVIMIAAPLVGYARNRRLSSWLPVGVFAGVACWVAPVLQQLTSRPGNLALLLGSGHNARPAEGIAFGLRSLDAAVVPVPTWWGRGEVQTDLFALARGISSRPAWTGILLLVGLAVCAGLAWLMHRRDLSALALITLLASVMMAWTFASLPTSQFLNYWYIGPSLWPLGMTVLLIGAWSVGEIVVPAGRRVARRLRPYVRPLPSAATTPRWVPSLTMAVVIVAGAIGSGFLMARDSALNDVPTAGWPAMHQVQAATRRIERAVPRGPLLVLPPPGLSASYAVIPGVDWLLYSEGWRPESFPGYPTLIGPEVAPARHLPTTTATVTYNGRRTVVVISKPVISKTGSK